MKTSEARQLTCQCRFHVGWIPSVPAMTGNPYWSMLATSLAQCGAHVIDGALNVRWLFQHRGHVEALHVHFVQQHYAYRGATARLRWVLRLARNLILARLLGYRVVFTLHDLKPTWPLRPQWVDTLGHLAVVWLANAVIVHCEAARTLLAAHYGRRRGVRVVPHPSYLDVYPNVIGKAAARERLGLTDAQIVYTFFGGIRPNKGVTDLLRAFSDLPGESARLVIAGKPWPPESYVDAVRQMAQRDSRVRLVAEQITDDDVQVYLNAADVMVMPFEEVLTSGSTMLALSFGRAVIVPKRGCLSELVTPQIGTMYEPSEPDGLRHALEARTPEELRLMGEQAREVAMHFDPVRVAEATFAVYEGRL